MKMTLTSALTFTESPESYRCVVNTAEPEHVPGCHRNILNGTAVIEKI